MTTTTTTTVHFEVIFGAGEADRQTYTDHGDGSFISRTAEARATSFFLDLAAKGVRCGFYANGVFVAGEDVCADELTDADFPEPVQHKTRCFSVEVSLDPSRDERGGLIGRYDYCHKAVCRCGWSSGVYEAVEIARAEARGHRSEYAAVAA